MLNNTTGRETLVLNIAICDDNIDFLTVMHHNVKDVCNTLNVAPDIKLYDNPLKLMDDLAQPDNVTELLLLDVDMPQMSGLELASKIRETDNDIIIIFVSSYDQYVRQSIEYLPFRYIKKEKLQPELFAAIQAASLKISNSPRNSCIIVKASASEQFKVRKKEIMYIELIDRKLIIHTKKLGDIVTRASMKEVISQLNNKYFFQLHPGCIVNIKYIAIIESEHSIMLDNGTRLIISRAKVTSLKDALLEYWREDV